MCPNLYEYRSITPVAFVRGQKLLRYLRVSLVRVDVVDVRLIGYAQIAFEKADRTTTVSGSADLWLAMHASICPSYLSAGIRK